jgi:hypothetical protein
LPQTAKPIASCDNQPWQLPHSAQQLQNSNEAVWMQNGIQDSGCKMMGVFALCQALRAFLFALCSLRYALMRFLE